MNSKMNEIYQLDIIMYLDSALPQVVERFEMTIVLCYTATGGGAI